ncbi:MAG: 23S rRNA (pseudouridine(1915)-N(3))-methyltransferase RlmH [Methanoregula sp.]|jgi:23S rRNA (pseudouridine1915-N3)-methyltransferase
MQIRVIAVGKIKEHFLQDGIAEYEKRLRPYAKLQIVEIADEKRPATVTAAIEKIAIEKEGDRICAAIPDHAYVVALDVKGIGWSSEELAGAFREWEIAGKSHIAFVVGGDLGLSPAVLSRCDFCLSLSKMTFTHPMARLLLLEQIYRAFRILRGEPYHK